MNVSIGGNSFKGVTVPLLWGRKAVIQRDNGQVSVIDLSGESARLEVLDGQPSDGVAHRPIDGGFEILEFDTSVAYEYLEDGPTLHDPSKLLPDCRIESGGILVGTNFFGGNSVEGFAAGLVVDSRGISMAGPLPEGLARLSI